MAIMITIHCKVCGETKREARSPAYSLDDVCGSCRVEAEKLEKQKWKAGREVMSLEDRIRDLEDFMYRHMKVSHTGNIYG